MKTAQKARQWAERADKVGMPDLARALRRWAKREERDAKKQTPPAPTAQGPIMLAMVRQLDALLEPTR